MEEEGDFIKQINTYLKPNNFDEYLTRILNLLNEKLDMVKAKHGEGYEAELVKELKNCRIRL